MAGKTEVGVVAGLALVVKILVVPIVYGLLLYEALPQRSGSAVAVISAAFFAYLQIRLVGTEGTCCHLRGRLEEQNGAIDRLLQADRCNHG